LVPWLKQDFMRYVQKFLVRAVTTLLLASKLIFCWKLISLDVDFIFGALRREGKNGTLIAFWSGTSLCDTWLPSLVVACFTGNLWMGPPQNSIVLCRNNAMYHFSLSEYWRKENRPLEGFFCCLGGEFFILVNVFTIL